MIAALVAANIGVFGVLWYVRSLNTTFEEAVTRDDAVVSELAPKQAVLDPRVFLLIGSDSREALPDDFGGFGTFGGQRADVIMMVHVDPGNGTAQILSIPRDTMVEIEGHGTDKINAAYAYGGAPLMVRTIKDNFGVHVHNFVEVNFYGFASIVDAIGGVELCLEYPARDAKSQLDAAAGCNRVDGRTALAYARSRQYEELKGGTWVTQEGGDISRTHRQQELVYGIIKELKDPSTVGEAAELIRSLGSYLTIDGSLQPRELAELAWAMRELQAEDLEPATLPTDISEVEGVWYNLPAEPAASEMTAAFAHGEPMSDAVPDEPLRLVVRNGNGVVGAAGLWAETLESAGFEVVDYGDASTFDYDVTVIRVRPEMTRAATALRESLGFGEITTGAVPDGVDAVVTIGEDAKGY
ncbi:MAG TPA: LCP family protein [Acidimicrobiia bacterium]|nr:LCP family protein [Acidimicrobiia bacterium]